MNTNELINALTADAKTALVPVRTPWRVVLLLAIAFAALAFFAALGPRQDVTVAAHTGRFLFKFVLTTVLAITAFAGIRTLSRPGATTASLAWLLAAPLLLCLAVVFELASVPPSLWAMRMVGSNSLLCLTFIPLIGVGPLILFLAALRQGAPTRPVIAGAVAGLLAGGVAASFYAIHCTDDSPLFVVTWYTTAIIALAAVGALLAPRIARW